MLKLNEVIQTVAQQLANELAGEPEDDEREAAMIDSTVPPHDTFIYATATGKVKYTRTPDSVTEVRIPRNYEEAMSGPNADKWKEAMQKERDALREMHTWDVVPLSSVPRGRRSSRIAISSKSARTLAPASLVMQRHTLPF